MAKYKENQKVRIIANLGGHEFNIGEIVKIYSVEDLTGYQNYVAISINKCFNDTWWVDDRELAPIIKILNKQTKVL